VRGSFSLFQSHLDFAHKQWQELLTPDDTVIDATCGNGHDALALALLIPQGRLFLLDIQQEAIASAESLLAAKLPKESCCHISFHKMCHSQIDEIAAPSSIKLIVYNLGYLPGKDKALTTRSATTLESIEKGLRLLSYGGVMSITCYPGHAEGAREFDAIYEYTKGLSPKEWSVSLHSWNNRQKHPCLFLIQFIANG
jgi:hypothetical protein